MSIKIHEPLVLANAQDIEVTNILMQKGPNGWESHITYTVLDETGLPVKEDVLIYRGADYDAWWGNFNAGSFLYEEYRSHKKIADPVEDQSEGDFVNLKPVLVNPVPLPPLPENEIASPPRSQKNS